MIKAMIYKFTLDLLYMLDEFKYIQKWVMNI